MFKSLLSSSISSSEEFLKELKSSVFNEIKINQAFKNNNIDLNAKNEDGETFLHICCKGNYFQAVNWLLENGADIEAQTNDGSTPIFYSIYTKDRGVINLLIEHNANVNHTNNFKRTVLQEAVISASNKFIDLLLSKTTNLNNCDVYGNNLIFDAIANGSIDIINKIAQIKEININQVNEEGHTILHKESVLKNKELILHLLEGGANPTILDKQGKNFLFYAVSKGFRNVEIFYKAIEMGCNLNSRSSNNTTILMESINYFLKTPKDDKEERENHFKMILELIKLDVNTSAVDDENENALFKAIRSGDEKLIEIFMEDPNMNINHKNTRGETILSLLIYDGFSNLKLIQECLQKGANPNIRDENEVSLVENLIDAILYFQSNKKVNFEFEKKLNRNGEYLTVLMAVLKHGNVDLEQLNSIGEPIFFQSLIYHNFKLFKLLRKYNIDINQKDIFGNNIIFKLMEMDDPKTRDELRFFLSLIQSLINLGVNINSRNNEGQTILHKALIDKNEYVLKLLLDAKVNVLAKDSQGRTVAHVSILKNKSLKCLKLIAHYDKSILDIPDKYGIKPINYAAFMRRTDLLVYMLDNEVLVNNTEDKDPEMLKFFTKFHKNIIDLPDLVENELDKVNFRLLRNTMVKEFGIKE